ncbi:MAG: phosphopantothenoylcysteine decarboxylase [Candidatus Omnitrophota bacterium]|nr:phosphopantothenoylcysteine decarboxylase [Candidatus Omnitrophota bacterium]
MRFISNRSTGYMGYKIAEEALKRKHKVILISGPTNLTQPKADKNISIQTADDLLKELKREIRSADCLVMCAAVGDFRARRPSMTKIKRKKRLCLELIPNEDILKKLSKFHKHNLFVGFSLETENLIRNSYLKLKNKNLDLIAANSFTKYHNPFGDNKLDVDLIDKNGDITKIRNKNKAFIAHVLLDKLEELWYLKNK